MGDLGSIPGLERSSGERIHVWASLIAQLVKNSPAMQETLIGFLGREEKRRKEKGKAAHSSILAQRIPWTEEPGRLQSMGLQRDGQD